MCSCVLHVLLIVESPNDEFQLVRDFVDVTNFHNLKTFDEIKLKKLHYKEMVEEFKHLYKVNQVKYNEFILYKSNYL